MVISDPHIKIDPDYSVYAKAKEQGFFVRNHEGGDFEGVCWPGKMSFDTPVIHCLVPTNEGCMAMFLISCSCHMLHLHAFP